MSITYTGSISGGYTNRDLSGGSSISVTCSASGSVPSGASITGGTITISSIKVYGTSGCTMNMSPWGSFTLPYKGSSGSVTATVSGITGTLSSQISLNIRNNTMVNYRSGCSITFTVNYTESGGSSGGDSGGGSVAGGRSTGRLSSASITGGDVITLTINPASSSYTHTMKWVCGAATSIKALSAGHYTSQFTTPTVTSTITGSVVLTTFSGGTQVNAPVTYTFSVTPVVYTPEISSFSATRTNDSDVPADWDACVKGHSKVTLTVTADSGGGTISGYTFSVGSQSGSSSGPSWGSGWIQDYGTVLCRAVVANTNGKTDSIEANITVYDYDPPVIQNARAIRCTSDGDVTENGSYIKASCDVSCSSVNSLNSISATGVAIQIREIGASAWGTVLTIVPGEETIVNAGLISGKNYEAQITVTDCISATTKAVTITAGGFPIYFKSGGQGVSIGKIGTQDQALEINEDWSILHGDKNLANALLTSGGTATGAIKAFNQAPALTSSAARVMNIYIGSAAMTENSPLSAGVIYLQTE